MEELVKSMVMGLGILLFLVFIIVSLIAKICRPLFYMLMVWKLGREFLKSIGRGAKSAFRGIRSGYDFLMNKEINQ